MSNSMPKLPARKAPPPQGAVKSTGPPPPAAGLHEAMLSQVTNAASNPAILRLMESPDLIEAVKDRDPMLRRLLEQNPSMSELLAPEKLRTVMEMVKGSPMFSALGTSEQRKAGEQSEGGAALQHMRARMQQLQQHLAAQAAGSLAATGAAAPRPWSSGMVPPHQSPAFFMQPSMAQPSMARASAASGSSAAVQQQQQGAAGGGSGGEAGGYSFSHSEREVTLDELPYDGQEKLLEAYGITRDDLADMSGAPGSGSTGSGPGGEPGWGLAAAAAADGGGGARQVALPSFMKWQQEQMAAAARAAQALPPSAWTSLPQGPTHGSAPLVDQATPLPMSTPSRDEVTPGGTDAARGGGGGAPGGPWLGPGPGHSPGHFHGTAGQGMLPALGGHHHQHHDHHHGGGHGTQPGGKPCCSGHGHGPGQNQHMYGDEYGMYGGQFGMYGLDGGPARKLRPRDYYEPVAPNLTWRQPEGQEGCGSLYRKAYHSYCDMMLFPPLFAVGGLLLAAAPGLPLWLLAGGLLAAVLPGTYCYVVVLAGLPRDKMPASRSFMSLIATCEVVYPIVFGCRVLPYWHGLTSTATLLLLACFTAMPLLHFAAATADPGYVPRLQDLREVKATQAAEEVKSTQAQQDGAPLESQQQQPLGEGGRGHPTEVAGGPGAAAAAAAGLGLGMLGLGMTAPLPDEDGGDGGGVRQRLLADGDGSGGGGEASGAKVAADWAERQCITCLVARPLRSKHCQFCNRCVRRFDHHCPAIANCVGEANERSFAAWLYIMWLTQILVVYVALSYLLQRYLAATGQAAASSAPDTGPAAVWAALCWAAAGPERGLVLLAGLQALCFLPATYLAGRQTLCILANLTANELINRDRYGYLQDGQGGYCNRFDRGAVLNCFSFWLERNSNWRAQFDAGEREMCRRGVRRLSPVSVAWLMGWQDDFSARRDQLRQAVVDLRKDKARRGAAVRAEAAAAAATAAAKKT